MIRGGAWTDYIYANGKKIASIATVQPAIHMHGVRDQSNNMACGTIWYVSGQDNWANGYVIQPGDRLDYDLMQTFLSVGTALTFTDGSYASGVAPIDGQWHHVTIDLSGSVGKTVSSLVMGPGDAYDPQGSWDAYERNVVL